MKVTRTTSLVDALVAVVGPSALWATIQPAGDGTCQLRVEDRELGPYADPDRAYAAAVQHVRGLRRKPRQVVIYTAATPEPAA